MIISPSASFTRPADTTAYGANDLVANSTTAGDVVPMSFGVSQLPNGAGTVRRVRLFKDDETVTAASFTVHLFSQAPVVTNGDNAAFAVSTARYYIGSVAIDMSTGAIASTTDVWKAAALSPELSFNARNSGAIYGLLEAEAGYAPSSGEVFEVTLDIEG